MRQVEAPFTRQQKFTARRGHGVIQVHNDAMGRQHISGHQTSRAAAYNGYFGNWGNYPWLPSGTIVASDMQNGLYLLKLKFPVSTQSPATELPVLLSPNPASDVLTIRVFGNITGTWNYRLFNAAGQISKSGASAGGPEVQVRVNDLPTGLYFMEVRTEDGRSTTRRVVID